MRMEVGLVFSFFGGVMGASSAKGSAKERRQTQQTNRNESMELKSQRERVKRMKQSERQINNEINLLMEWLIAAAFTFAE